MVCPPGIGIRVSRDPGHAERSQEHLPDGARQNAANLAEAACDRGTQTSKRLCRTASRTAAATSSGSPQAAPAVAPGRRSSRSQLRGLHHGERHAATAVLQPQRFSQTDHAVLVAEYVALPGSGTRPTPEAMLTRCPPWHGSIRLSASFDPRVVP